MIFTDKFLFLHFPKTGGMMLTRQLLIKLQGPIFYSLPKGHVSPRERFLKVIGRIKILEGLRHENLIEAEHLFKSNDLEHRLSKFDCILVIVRNPYDYTVSRFNYLRYIQKHNKNGKSARLAKEGNFNKFVLNQSEEYSPSLFLKDNKNQLLPNLRILKYEDMTTQLNKILEPYVRKRITFDKVVNKSQQAIITDYIQDSEVERTIYERHKSLFDLGLYERAKI